MSKAYKIDDSSVVMPAGEYWVGDPCYSVPNERWIEWLEAADYESERTILLAELDGNSVLGINTAYGDGQYEDEQGRVYPVDAGLIGVTPVEVVGDQVPSGAHRLAFANDFSCSYDKGTIILGHISINTDPADEDTCWSCGYSMDNCCCDDPEGEYS
jgi:hypothetical protein